MATEPRTSEIRHQRETLRLVILPMSLVVIAVVACLIGVMLLPRRAQVSVVSDVVLTVLMLCPAVLCVLPITILTISGILAMNRAHDAASGPLRRLEDMSARLAERAESSTDMVNRQTIGISARLGFLYRLMSKLESHEDNNTHD